MNYSFGTDEYIHFILDKLQPEHMPERSVDTLIDETNADSQKFLYLRTKDNLITPLRLLKDGYVYVDEIGFLQLNQADFDEFYGLLQ